MKNIGKSIFAENSLSQRLQADSSPWEGIQLLIGILYIRLISREGAYQLG